MDFDSLMVGASELIDYTALFIIFLGLFYSFVVYFYHLFSGKKAFSLLRQNIARTILIAIELLIASDIIVTLSAPTDLESVVALGLIIVLRVLLSLEMERELTGRWPIPFFKPSSSQNSLNDTDTKDNQANKKS